MRRHSYLPPSIETTCIPPIVCLRGQATYLHAVSLLINGTSNMKCNIYTTSHNITTQRMGGSRATLTARARARKARQGKASWEIQTHEAERVSPRAHHYRHVTNTTLLFAKSLRPAESPAHVSCRRSTSNYTAPHHSAKKVYLSRASSSFPANDAHKP